MPTFKGEHIFFQKLIVPAMFSSRKSILISIIQAIPSKVFLLHVALIGMPLQSRESVHFSLIRGRGSLLAPTRLMRL